MIYYSLSNSVYLMVRPLNYKITNKDEMIIFSCDDLRIRIEVSENKMQTLNHIFAEEIDFLWKSFVDINKDHLKEDELILRKRLRQHFAELTLVS